MKKNFLLMVGLILLVFTACQSDELVNGGRNGEVAASFSVQLPDDGSAVATRAAGDGTQVNRCIMEVYLNDELYERKVEPVTSLTVKFDIRLVTSQTYKFVFWADHVTSTEGEAIKTDLHYATDDLRNISFNGNYYGSSKDDTRDAFFAKDQILVTNTFSKAISLTRPFGQLNIKTTDISEIKNETLKPALASLSFAKVYTSFNALTGETIGELSALSYQDAADVVDGATGDLTVDYILAPSAGQLLVNMSLTANSSSAALITSKELNSIPIQRNYKTNVSGNLLTANGAFKVTVAPNFTGELSEKVVEVQSVDEVETALATNTNVVVATAPAQDAIITLPKYANKEVAVSVTLPSTSSKVTFKVAEGDGNNPPATLAITSPSAANLVIEAPKTTVTLNGIKYVTVDATTADNTLIIGSGVEVGTLNVKKGSVKLYGKVTALTKADGWQGTITRCVSNQSDVENLLIDSQSGYSAIAIESQVTGVLDFKNTPLSKLLTVSTNAEIKNLTLTTTEKNAVIVDKANVKLILRTSTLTSSANSASVVMCLSPNPHLEIYSSEIVASGGEDVRGVNAYAEDVASNSYILLDATYIRATVAKIGNEYYTDEQIEDFKKTSYSRGLNVGLKESTSRGEYNIKNGSVIEGFFYAVNVINGVDGTQAVFNIDKSTIDGRAGINVWPSNCRFYITNSTLIGRNYFTGTSENFATIVVNKEGANIASNTTIDITDSEIYSYNTPQVDTNYQFSVDLRSDNNTLNLKNTKLIEKGTAEYPVRLDYFILNGDPSNKVNVDATVIVEGKEGATALPK